MKVTSDRLAVGHAVWDAAKEFFAAPDTAPIVYLDAVIEAIPEPEPVPAPTGPGWWFARDSGEWEVVEVDYLDGELCCWVTNVVGRLPTTEFGSWVGPLIAPTANGGAE